MAGASSMMGRALLTSDAASDAYSTSFGQPGAIAGTPDTAVGFNGPSSMDYVEIGEPADGSQAFSQPTSGAGLTVEAWLRPDALTFAGETKDIYPET